MMRVLMIVQEFDENSWLRGFIVRWAIELAKQVEQLYVLTLELGTVSAEILPPNLTVYSMGKEQGYGNWRELFGFYRGVWRFIGKVDVIFSHMTPRFTWLAAPLAILYHKPQMLWFTHPKNSLELQLAFRAAKWITTATDKSFPIHADKVHVMGHGIDTDLFAPPDTPSEDAPPIILAVGRVTPIKHHEILLEAVKMLHERGVLCRTVIVGGLAAQGDAIYQARLLQKRDALGLSAREFDLVGTVNQSELVTWYHRSAVATNLTPKGSFDKAGLEAMLTGTPLITANPTYNLGEHEALLRLRQHDNPAELADTLASVLALTSEARHKIGLSLRDHTALQHGLASLVTRLVKLMKNERA